MPRKSHAHSYSKEHLPVLHTGRRYVGQLADRVARVALVVLGAVGARPLAAVERHERRRCDGGQASTVAAAAVLRAVHAQIVPSVAPASDGLQPRLAGGSAGGVPDSPLRSRELSQALT